MPSKPAVRPTASGLLFAESARAEWVNMTGISARRRLAPVRRD
ncbi:MAG: hypothetical protein ABI131_09985 [Nostocoides sp.]